MLRAGDGWTAGEVTVGEPRPKSLRFSVDFGLATDGLVRFLTRVSGAGVVVVGDIRRLQSLGWRVFRVRGREHLFDYMIIEAHRVQEQ